MLRISNATDSDYSKSDSDYSVAEFLVSRWNPRLSRIFTKSRLIFTFSFCTL